MNGLVSVIVPIYKVENYLDRCISSIVNQTYENLEIILVDDGSPDKCPQMCDNWAKKDNRIIVVHKENGGLSDARNAGLEIATGKYVSFIDSDDWISLNFIESLFNVIKEDDFSIVECDYLITSCNKVDKVDNSLLKVLYHDPAEAMELHLKDILYKQVVWNKLYKRELLDVRFEKGKYHEDVFWTYQIIAKSKRLAHVELPLYYYYQRNDSIMGEKYSVKRLDAIEAYEQRCKFICENIYELSDIAQKEFIGTCMYHSQLILNSKIENKIGIIIELNGKSKAIGNKWKKSLNVDLKNKIWLYLYLYFPLFICKIRNVLKIGL